MTRLSLLGSVLCAAILPSALLAACATDNGDAVHGPQFGPTPERPDGASSEGSVEPDPEGGPSPTDGGSEADAPISTCSSGTVVVLAGSDTALTGAAQIAGAAWSGAAIAGAAAKDRPAIVPFGTGFLALTRGPADKLMSLSFGASSWGAAAAIGAETTIGAPALAVVGTKAHGVYLTAGAPKPFLRVENTGAAWSAASPVTSGGSPSFGQSGGSLSAAGTDLVFAQDGGNNDGLFTQRYDGAAWSVGTGVLGAGTLTTAPPTLAAIDGGGAFDTVLVYADNTPNHVIGFTTRDATTKLWATAAVTSPLAQTGEQPSLARVSATGLVVTFRGNDQRPYTMRGTIGATTVTWSAPVALLADTSTVDGAPAVAKGVCGDEAIAVFASGGQVKATRFRGTSWTVPEAVSGAAGTRVSIATR